MKDYPLACVVNARKLVDQLYERNHHAWDELDRELVFGINALITAIRHPTPGRNFCERCGKRLFDGIHTCTPPMLAHYQWENEK